jgi:hypothetical protein
MFSKILICLFSLHHLPQERSIRKKEEEALESESKEIGREMCVFAYFET